MHDCQATKARLLDLVCGDAADADALRAEVRSCEVCAAERRALSEIFRAFDGAAAEARPPEEFWPGYHARLASRLAAAEPGAARAREDRALDLHARRRPAPFAARLRRALTASWSVPAPVALAAVLLIVCLTPLALRPSAVNVAPPPRGIEPSAAANERPVQTIEVEVPVVREKIVTRTVYVTRPARKRARATRAGDAGLASGSSPLPAEAAPGRDTLTGFRPAGDVRLRVIKGSFENER